MKKELGELQSKGDIDAVLAREQEASRLLAVYTEMRDINKAFACVLDTDLPDLPRLYAGPAVESALCGLAQQILQEGGQAVPQASAAAAEKPEINTGETQEPKIVENARKKSEESTQPG